MSKILFLFTTLVLSINCFGHKTKQNRGSFIKINLTNFANPFTFQSIDLSIEKYVTNKLSIQAELGLPIFKYNAQGYYSTNPDTSFGRNFGYKSNIELRLNRWKEHKNRKTNFYMALNFSFANYQTNVKMDYSLDSIKVNQDCFYLKRREFGVTPTTGYKISKGKLILEMFIGLGLINQNIKNQHREFRNDIAEQTSQRHNIFGIGKSNLSENSGWRIKPSIGIRFGFIINSRKR